MPTNNDIKEKIYQETLNQLAKSIPSYTNDDALATTWEDANTELYVIEVEDIEKALHFAIDKTEAEARSDTLIRVKHELEAIADIGHEQPHVLPAFKADAGKKWLGFTKDDWDKFWKENKEAD